MKAPATPADEVERLADLRSYDVLDSEREPAFDRLTQLAATLFEVPIATISLVDKDRQWFKSEFGLGATETSREVSFCGHAIHDSSPMVVSDALEDERFFDNPLVSGNPRIRFYAGAPLITPRGNRIGTLCIIDKKPRQLSTLQRQVLADLASLATDQLELRLARQSKEREAHSLRQLLANMPVAVQVISDMRIVFVNDACLTLTGYTRQQLLGADPTEYVAEEERAIGRKQLAGMMRGTTDRRIVHADGNSMRLQMSAMPMLWEGKPALVTSMRDVGAERAAQELRDRLANEVANELGLLLAVFDELPEGVALYDEHFRVAYANRALGTMFGVDVKTVAGWTPEQGAEHVASMSDEPERVRQRLREMRAGPIGESTAAVFSVARPKPRVLRRSLHAVGIPSRPWVVVWTDITAETAALRKVELDAATDALTGLMNRRGIEPAIQRAIVNGGRMAVAVFDVDHFKKVNDTWGHPVGDEVLKLVAKTLAGTARGGDLVARWGGEEFIALLRADAEGASKFAERARAAVAKLDTPAGRITISVGVATSQPGIDPVKKADANLYQAKTEGRNRVIVS